MTESYWIWFALAGILLVFEMLTFSIYALWIAIGAGLTGLLALFFPMLDRLAEVFIFSGFACCGLAIGYVFFRSNKIQHTDDNVLNQRGNQYIGQIYTLEENVVDSRAHLKIADTLWRIECDQDLLKGSKVEVVSVNGNRLKVKPH